MATLTIPRNLADDVASSGDATRRAGLEALPDVVAELSDRWSLTVGQPYSPGGCCSWVAPAHMGGARGDREQTAIAPARSESGATAAGRARAAHGERVVLKVGWSHYESLHEADGLRAWNGNGAVRLIAAHRSGQTSALLLERCVPGATLAETEDELSQDVIVAGLLGRLWIEPGAVGVSRPEAADPTDSQAPGAHGDSPDVTSRPFRPLQEMCDRWADGFEEVCDRGAVTRHGGGAVTRHGGGAVARHGGGAVARHGGGAVTDRRARERPAGRLDPGVTREGVALFRALPSSASRSVLLCTDLHAENVLAAEREPWLAIDPKPYVGDPAYDVLQHMLNCDERLRAEPRALARRMAELCDLDPDRVTAWLLARAVLESIDAPKLADVAHRLAGVGGTYLAVSRS